MMHRSPPPAAPPLDQFDQFDQFYADSAFDRPLPRQQRCLTRFDRPLPRRAEARKPNKSSSSSSSSSKTEQPRGGADIGV